MGMKTPANQDIIFMSKAIELSSEGMNQNCGGPFGAVIVKNGKIIGKGFNQVIKTNDPTAHAEIVAIREASRNINSFDLSGCEIYTSCEPCPMCLSAIYWANIDKIYYANTKEDAALAGFRDDFIYEEISKKIEERKKVYKQISRDQAQTIFMKWINKADKIEY
jgi:guanine deaminase